MQLKEQKIPPFIEQNLFNLAILGLLGIVYLPVILFWIDGWLNKSINIEHEYFSVALIGFPLAGYIVWEKRHQWQDLESKSHPIGISLLVIATIFYLTDVREFVNISFPIMLTGICLCLKGIKGLKLQFFPLVLVWLATPTSWPYLLTPHTLFLQKFIASFAGIILGILGMDVQVREIYLTMGDRVVEIAPYCAGLKMLFTSLYVALILLYWTQNLGDRTKVTIMLIGTTIISVVGNILRNTLLSYLHGTRHDEMFKLIHDSWGGDLYSAATLGLIILFMQQLDQLSFEEHHN
jgi:cyanoexosortase B